MAAITSRGDDEACCNDGYHSGGGDDARVRQAASYEPERVTCSGRAWHAGLVVEVKAQRKGILELLVKNRVGVEKLGSETRFPSEGFLPVRVFLAVVCFLRGCHRWLHSHVEEPHQSFQVLCHGC